MSALKLPSRAVPFVVGFGGAALAFAFFSFDLKYHWVPYSSPRQKFYPWFMWLAIGVSWIVPWLRRQGMRSWPWVAG